MNSLGGITSIDPVYVQQLRGGRASLTVETFEWGILSL
jgi:hypothetical protein